MTLREQVDDHLDGHAERSLDKAGWDIQSAVDDMVSNIETDPRLREETMRVLLQIACYERVRSIVHRHNKALWNNAERGDALKRDGQRLRTAARYSSKLRLMNYMLMGGIALGDATKAVLERNYDFQRRQATRMARTSKWFKLIMDRMSAHAEDATVRSVLEEEDLIRLRDMASREER